jgi:hypothetical protein
VAELDGEPEDAVAGLVREAARRTVIASKDPIPLEVHQALLDINEPNTKRSAIDMLLTWLGSRSEVDGV